MADENDTATATMEAEQEVSTETPQPEPQAPSFDSMKPEDQDRAMIARFNEHMGIKADEPAGTEGEPPVETKPAQPAKDKAVAKDGKAQATDGQARDDKGKFQPKTDPVADKPKSRSVDLPDGGKFTVTVDQARNAMKRGQFPEKVIASLTEDEILEHGLKLARSQSEQDRLGSEKARLQKLLSELEEERNKTPKSAAQAATGDKAATGAKPTATPSDDGDPIEPLLTKLRGDELYAELVDPLEKALRGIQGQNKTALDVLARKDERIEELYWQIDRMNLHSARNRLTDRFPKLADEESFEKVRKSVYELAKLDGYADTNGAPDWDRLVTHAARLEGLDSETLAEQQAKLGQRYKKQTDSQLTHTAERTKPGRAMSIEEKEQHAAKLLSQGKTPDEVRKLLASIPSE